MARWNEEDWREPWRREDWRRSQSWRGGDWRGPGEGREGGPFRRGDDYGAREFGADDFERWYGAGGSRRGEGRTDPRRGRDVEPPRGERAGGWDDGDYTTYGQSGYSNPGRGMHRDLVREQGPHGLRHEPGRPGRGPKGWKRSDERIHDDVCERIARSGVNADDVEVRVENGEVTLTGNAETRSDKRMIEDLADDVLGVHDVHNQIRVQRAERGGTVDPDAGSGRRDRTH